MSTTPIHATAKLLERQIIADTVYEFKFQMVKPRELEFEAGQYIALEIDSKTRRQYSISTSPLSSKDIFKIVIDIKPDGVGTKYLMSLKVGDEIRFIGQIGLFVLPEELEQNLFFIATGVGLAPLKSMVETLISDQRNLSHNIYVQFGTRSIGDIFYEDLFNTYFSTGLIKDYKIYLSQASMPGSIEGYVTQFVNLYDSATIENAQFFLCGSGAMIRDVEEELNEKNISPSSVFYEKFY